MTPPPRRRSTSGPFGVGRGTAGLCEAFESPGHGSHDLRATLPHATPKHKIPRRVDRAEDFTNGEGVEERLGKWGGF